MLIEFSFSLIINVNKSFEMVFINIFYWVILLFFPDVINDHGNYLYNDDREIILFTSN
jgi:hypothetical protein